MGHAVGGPIRRWFHGAGFQWFRRWARKLSGALVSWVAIVQAARPDAFEGFAQAFVQFWHDAGWAWLLLAIALGVAGWFKGADPIPTNATDAILTEFQKALFGHTGDDDAHHRVTLFKRVRLRPRIVRDAAGGLRGPLSGWLVPVARSGHGTKHTRTKFLCPDDTDQAQGIAGRAWASPAAIVQDLPDMTAPSDSTQVSYARATNVPVEWIQKRKRPEARSLMGLRIDDARTSKPWGVLVIDSRAPSFDTQLARAQFNAYAPVLSALAQSM